ncbi:YcfL family protein [Sulfurimonas sp. SAG-AH-194-I05]|nr:YcfL family protein [Sulfurimonas sp. SAG-AH-194-I05]MDF1875245.1 YcfL family protein [Sulfurimonas sp. SAG-AH-194-I05]
MYKKILFTLFLLFSIQQLHADLFGDGTNSNTLTSPKDEVTINDLPLSYMVKIVGSTSRFVYDLLDARVTIQSDSDTQHTLEYRFIWFDEEGFEMGKHLSKWKHVTIDAKDTVVVKELALTSKVDSFKFYLRDRE